MKKKFWHAFLTPSTIAFLREGRAKPGYTWFDGLHGYVYGRWPYLGRAQDPKGWIVPVA